ncbi:unnamed protein product [Hymenolepis diminuta]|uniref:Uncharacterized protein n=1 Tax=Hymenolepis diminuta TaxID=6216 RepID=A0A564Y8R4_HYMDI|nr:unnamed protein product [Hymenolepis diminuta]
MSCYCVCVYVCVCVGGALPITLVHHVRGYGFYSHRHTPSDRDGQPYWLSLANILRGRTLVSYRGGSIMSLYPI